MNRKLLSGFKSFRKAAKPQSGFYATLGIKKVGARKGEEWLHLHPPIPYGNRLPYPTSEKHILRWPIHEPPLKEGKGRTGCGKFCYPYDVLMQKTCTKL
jgi:hypothetical protein